MVFACSLRETDRDWGIRGHHPIPGRRMYSFLLESRTKSTFHQRAYRLFGFDHLTQWCPNVHWHACHVHCQNTNAHSFPLTYDSIMLNMQPVSLQMSADESVSGSQLDGIPAHLDPPQEKPWGDYRYSTTLIFASETSNTTAWRMGFRRSGVSHVNKLSPARHPQ